MSVQPICVGFSGVFTALVTPMLEKKSASAFATPPAIDEIALGSLVEKQIRSGVSGLVACGTTGEAAAMSAPEQARVIRCVVEAAAGRVPVLAGVGSPSTAHSIELGHAAIAAGAFGLLAVTPYYNRPPQAGLIAHFRALASLKKPIMLYNVPSRTGCDLLPDTVARLCELPEVVSIKEASGSVQRTEQLVRKLGERLTVLSGEDALNYPLYCVGARGTVSVVSNVAPRLTVDVYEATRTALHGDGAKGQTLAQAEALHHLFVPLAEELFSEPNPIPAKAALAMMEEISPALRLPLVAMSEAGQARLRTLLGSMGFLK